MAPQLPRVLEGMHVVFSPPGETPPDSVPRDAVRCDLVEWPTLSVRYQLVPSAQGKYLAFETEPNEVGQLLGRGAALIMGTLIAGWEIADLLGDGPHEWWSLLPMAGFALTLLYFAVTGRDPRPEAEPPPSLRFRAMADPTHPLSPAFRPQPAGSGELPGSEPDPVEVAARIPSPGPR